MIVRGARDRLGEPRALRFNGIIPAIGDTGKSRNRVRCQLVRVRADR